MDRRIKEYLATKEQYTKPYINHNGSGSGIGTGNKYGIYKGGFYKPRNEDYNGKDIVSYNGNKVYKINGYTLYISNIRQPLALAKIIKNDLTTQNGYIGKINDNIVIASSIREVLDLMREEIKMTGNNDNDIAEAFVHMHPYYEKEYDWEEMVFWHSLSEFSCADGRRRFSENAEKEIGSTATPKELIYFMKQTRAHKIAKKMEELYLSKK